MNRIPAGQKAVDIRTQEITVKRMTLLQTRVDERVASQFRQAAKQRAMSPYQLLGELVKQVSGSSSQGWKEHRVWLRGRNRTPLKKNAVVQSREDESR